MFRKGAPPPVRSKDLDFPNGQWCAQTVIYLVTSGRRGVQGQFGVIEVDDCSAGAFPSARCFIASRIGVAAGLQRRRRL
jgi:hypothetical protein